MVSPSSAAEFRTADETLHAIDDLVHEITRLSKSELSPREFHAELLDRAVPALAAVGGVVWTRTSRGDWQAECRSNVGTARFAERPADEQGHRTLLEHVLKTG